MINAVMSFIKRVMRARRLEKELIERLGFPRRLAQIAAAPVKDQNVKP